MAKKRSLLKDLHRHTIDTNIGKNCFRNTLFSEYGNVGQHYARENGIKFCAMGG